MAVPKRRSSRHKKGIRRGSDAHKRPVRASNNCPQCGAIKQPHRVCPSCGYYNGRAVLTVSADD